MSKSSRLGLSEVRSIFRLIGNMRELKGDTGRRQLIHGLCDLLGARQGTMLKFDGFTPEGTPKLLEFVGGGWASPEAADLWESALAAGNWRGDPVLNEATRTRGQTRAFRRCELVSDTDYYAGEGYNLIAKVAGVDDALVGWFRHEEPGRVTAVAFQRAWGERQFAPRQREMLALVIDELNWLNGARKLEQSPVAQSIPSLPPRLNRLLGELLTGKGEKQIAASLGLSRLTVNAYTKDLYRIFGVESRSELMARFIQWPGGLATVGPNPKH